MIMIMPPSSSNVKAGASMKQATTQAIARKTQTPKQIELPPASVIVT